MTAAGAVRLMLVGVALWTAILVSPPDATARGRVPPLEVSAPIDLPFLQGIDPLDPLVVYGSDSAGLLRTSDGGLSWKRLPLTGLVNRVEISAAKRSRLFAQVYDREAQRIARSDDGGRSWRYVLELQGDRLAHFGAWDISADGSHIYVGVGQYTKRPSYFLVSSDAGAHWVRRELPYSTPDAPFSVVADLHNAAKVTVIGGAGRPSVFTSLTGGATWRQLRLPARACPMLIHPRINGVLLAASCDQNPRRLLWTRDSGAHWTRIRGWGGANLDILAFHPYRSHTFYAEGGPEWPGNLMEFSRDGRRTLLPDIAIVGFLISPGDPRVLYVRGLRDEWGILRSSDGGATWTQVVSE